ncbi:hypothetical protein [Bradyrhizobium genosp. P]|uniref:hypothetical protein n=1 Tax=Bradyrhizobium genosp. P TaxID=83641 RepID=UPI003CE7ADA2
MALCFSCAPFCDRASLLANQSATLAVDRLMARFANARPVRKQGAAMLGNTAPVREVDRSNSSEHAKLDY